MMQFISTTLHSLESWRSEYLESLHYAQDMHSESMIRWMPGATCWLLNTNDTPAGYIILNNTNELVEFYLNNDLLTQKEMVFSQQFRFKKKQLTYSLLQCL